LDIGQWKNFDQKKLRAETANPHIIRTIDRYQGSESVVMEEYDLSKATNLILYFLETNPKLESVCFCGNELTDIHLFQMFSPI